MYNYLVERMYAEYTTKSNDEVVKFMKGDAIVGVLYKKQQVLNIYLSASQDVIWNFSGLAIFVVAKNYVVINNAKAKKTEAAWVIGCLTSTTPKNLNNQMYLEYDEFWKGGKVAGVTEIYSSYKGVKFTLFDVEIQWQEKEQPKYNHISDLNPALIYPIKTGGKKIKVAKSYLRKKCNWEYESGYDAAGSYETREFIKLSNKVNHTKFSTIKYHKTSEK